VELPAGFAYVWGAAAEYFGKVSACLAISVRRESLSVGDRVFVVVLYLAQALQALVLCIVGERGFVFVLILSQALVLGIVMTELG